MAEKVPRKERSNTAVVIKAGGVANTEELVKKLTEVRPILPNLRVKFVRPLRSDKGVVVELADEEEAAKLKALAVGSGN